MIEYTFGVGEEVTYMMGTSDFARNVRALVTRHGKRTYPGRPSKAYYTIVPFYEDGRRMRSRNVAPRSICKRVVDNEDKRK